MVAINNKTIVLSEDMRAKAAQAIAAAFRELPAFGEDVAGPKLIAPPEPVEITDVVPEAAASDPSSEAPPESGEVISIAPKRLTAISLPRHAAGAHASPPSRARVSLSAGSTSSPAEFAASHALAGRMQSTLARALRYKDAVRWKPTRYLPIPFLG